jgi:hypothetical protein
MDREELWPKTVIGRWCPPKRDNKQCPRHGDNLSMAEEILRSVVAPRLGWTTFQELARRAAVVGLEVKLVSSARLDRHVTVPTEALPEPSAGTNLTTAHKTAHSICFGA